MLRHEAPYFFMNLDKSLVVKISIVLGSLFFSVILIEGILRLTTEQKQLSAPWFLSGDHGRIKDKDLIFSSAAVSDALRSGMKHADIIVLGDSFVEGNVVADSRNFPSRLGEYLRMNHDTDVVVNFGVGGYGPDQELKLLTTALQSGARPRVVIWALYDNDIYENYTQAIYDIDGRGRLVPIDATRNWLYVRQKYFDMIPLPRAVKLQSYLLNLYLFAFERWSNGAVPEKYIDNPDQWSMDKIPRELDAMEALSSIYQFKLIYVLITPQAAYMPPQEMNSDAQWGLDNYVRLQHILEGKQNVLMLDFRTDPIATSESALGSPRDIKDSIFLDARRDSMPKGQRHFNETGHDLFAKVVVHYMETNHMLIHE